MLFVEDPTFHSVLEVNIPVAGQAVGLGFAVWPPSPLWCIVKVVIFLVFTAAGMALGKFVLHKLIFKRWWRLKLFKEDRGSFFCMIVCAAPVIFIGSQVYNLIIALFMDNYEPYLLTGKIGIDNITFGKLTMVGTWLGDTTSLFLVCDMMLQDKKHYPQWSLWLRSKWDGWFVSANSFCPSNLLACDCLLGLSSNRVRNCVCINILWCH